MRWPARLHIVHAKGRVAEHDPRPVPSLRSSVHGQAVNRRPPKQRADDQLGGPWPVSGNGRLLRSPISAIRLLGPRHGSRWPTRASWAAVVPKNQWPDGKRMLRRRAVSQRSFWLVTDGSHHPPGSRRGRPRRAGHRSSGRTAHRGQRRRASGLCGTSLMTCAEAARSLADRPISTPKIGTPSPISSIAG